MRGGGWKFAVLPVIAGIAVALFVIGVTNSGSRHHHAAASPASQPQASVSGRPPSSAGAASRGRRLSHIAVIVMENKSYGNVIGSPDAPFINGLIRRYAVARDMYAVSHPSLPNYLALTGGSTFGITSNCTGCAIHATSLVDQLQSAGVSWKAYIENLPRPCFTGSGAGEYAKRHDPFVYYTRVTRAHGVCSHVVPLTQLQADERAGGLPRFVWITPGLCHDMHDCPVSTGDRFLSTLVPPLVKALGPDGVLFLTWDEGLSDAGCCRLASGGHIATILAGPGARLHTQLSTPADHYSVLRTIEDAFGLPRLRGAGCGCTASLNPLLVGY